MKDGKKFLVPRSAASLMASTIYRSLASDNVPYLALQLKGAQDKAQEAWDFILTDLVQHPNKAGKLEDKDNKVRAKLEAVLLYKAKIDIQVHDATNGGTMLHAAAAVGLAKSVELLLGLGLSAAEQDNQKHTPADVAAAAGFPDLFKGGAAPAAAAPAPAPAAAAPAPAPAK